MALDAEAAVPSGAMTPRFRRWLSVLVGLAALSATGLSLIESNSGRQEEQAFVEASRGALEIFVKIAASDPPRQFQANALRRTLGLTIESAAKVVASPADGEPFRYSTALADADSRAAEETRKAAQAMGRVSPRPPRLDPATFEAVNTNLSDFTPLVARQNAAVDRANRYGTRQERSMFGLGVVAIAASLLGLAGLMGATRAGRISLLTAAVALSVAVGSALSGFVV
jgi:hypothetical protein